MDPVARKVLAIICALVGIVLGVVVMASAHGNHAQLEIGGGIIAASAGVFVASA